MKRILLLSAIFSCGLAVAHESNLPDGKWSCSFFGDQWEMVPGPNGVPEQELEPELYTSSWRDTRDEAYDEALDDCQNWSDTGCSFSSCDQN